MKLVLLRCLALLAIMSASLSGFSQQLTWPTSQYDQGTTDVGGQTARPGVASAVFNNQVWIAYLNSNTCNGNLCYVVVKQNNGNGAAWSNEQYVYSQGTLVTSNANPTLAVLNGELYLAYTDANNNNWIIATNNGVSWTAPYQIASGYSTWYSPVMAVDQNGTGNSLYVAFESGLSPHFVILCQVASDFSSQTCQRSTGMSVAISYNPGIAVYNGVIYLGIINAQGCLSFYQTSTLSVSGIPWNPFQCGQVSNGAPSLAIYNGNLYTAYRTGGNNNYMTVATLANFPSSFGNTTPSVQTLSFGMGTGQMLPITNTLTGFPNSVLNLFTWQNRLYYTDGY